MLLRISPETSSPGNRGETSGGGVLRQYAHRWRRTPREIGCVCREQSYALLARRESCRCSRGHHAASGLVPPTQQSVMGGSRWIASSGGTRERRLKPVVHVRHQRRHERGPEAQTLISRTAADLTLDLIAAGNPLQRLARQRRLIVIILLFKEPSSHMSHEGSLDNVACMLLPGELGIVVGLQNAPELAQMLPRMLTFRGVAIEHRWLIDAGELSIVANIRRKPRRAGLDKTQTQRRTTASSANTRSPANVPCQCINQRPHRHIV